MRVLIADDSALMRRALAIMAGPAADGRGDARNGWSHGCRPHSPSGWEAESLGALGVLPKPLDVTQLDELLQIENKPVRKELQLYVDICGGNSNGGDISSCAAARR